MNMSRLSFNVSSLSVRFGENLKELNILEKCQLLVLLFGDSWESLEYSEKQELLEQLK